MAHSWHTLREGVKRSILLQVPDNAHNAVFTALGPCPGLFTLVDWCVQGNNDISKLSLMMSALDDDILALPLSKRFFDLFLC